MRVDPVLLERAIANLVDNALLHGRGVDGRPDAVVVEIATVADRVFFRIMDRGPGIPPSVRRSSSRSSGSATARSGRAWVSASPWREAS